jgi:two-component system, OmpR family, sensor histidine kinase KdpD
MAGSGQKRSKAMQYVISICLVLVVSMACFVSRHVIDYRVVALLLLVTVSSLAIVFDIFPVLIAAVFSALTLNFFFIEPIYNIHIKTTEDLLLLSMYLVIVLVNAVLTFKIRKAEKKAREKEEKENSIKLYTTLFNSLSHELKTPISTIIGAVDTLKETNSRLTETNRDELLSEIDKAGMRLNQQVENLLNMSRLESGFLKLNKDWCDLDELIHSVIQKLGCESTEHRITFHTAGELPLFRLDGVLIEQILKNVLHNALLYTPGDTIVSIGVSDDEDGCTIVISDNGRGFPEQEIGQVFEKFYRLPQAKAGGTGLGLSIAKGFAEAHDGTITLRNNAGGGAAFTVVLPCEKSYMNHLKNE